MTADIHPVFRKATLSDLPAVAAILRSAADRMMAEGKHQWTETYPGPADIRTDMENRTGYVLASGTEVVGYAAVIFDGEPAYRAIDGCWLSDCPYVVIHRVAVRQDLQRRGLGTELFDAVCRLATSKGVMTFRIDTNYDNTRMLNLIDKYGFSYCGEVMYGSGSRKAFEKLL